MKDSLNMRAKKKRDGWKERYPKCGHGLSKAEQQKVRYSQLQEAVFKRVVSGSQQHHIYHFSVPQVTPKMLLRDPPLVSLLIREVTGQLCKCLGAIII